MNRSRSRRQILAAAVPIALAGCLIEGTSDATTEGEPVTDGPNESVMTDDAVAGNANATEETSQKLETAGIEIERVDIVRTVSSINLSQLLVDIVVRNVGDFTYGTLELRVDAYYEPPDDDRTYHPPRVDERTAVGRAYADHTVENFESGTLTIEDVMIQYDAKADANGSTDPDEFDFEVVVRRAEPI